MDDKGNERVPADAVDVAFLSLPDPSLSFRQTRAWEGNGGAILYMPKKENVVMNGSGWVGVGERERENLLLPTGWN